MAPETSQPLSYSDIPNKEWEELLESYIATRAVLECRLIFFCDEEQKTYTMAIPDIEADKSHYAELSEKLTFIPQDHYGFQILSKIPTTNGVSTIQGVMVKYRGNERQETLEEKCTFEWHNQYCAWIGDFSGDIKCQILPGNLLEVTDDAEKDLLPRLYEFNRPDAPKDGIARYTLLS